MESQQVSTVTFSDCVCGCRSFTNEVLEVCVCWYCKHPSQKSLTFLCLQGVTVMVQGQSQTAGQLQVIPAGVTVIPAAGQQLMQAVLPNGQVQRFLFTPTSASPSTPGNRGFDLSLGFLICNI